MFDRLGGTQVTQRPFGHGLPSAAASVPAAVNRIGRRFDPAPASTCRRWSGRSSSRRPGNLDQRARMAGESEARDLLDRNLTLRGRLGDRRGIGVTILNQGLVTAAALGSWGTPIGCCGRSLAALR